MRVAPAAIITITTTIIITMSHYTEQTSYTQETPKPLWEAFTRGPAAPYDRYSQRLTELIAADVLQHRGDELDDDLREFCEEIVERDDVVGQALEATSNGDGGGRSGL